MQDKNLEPKTNFPLIENRFINDISSSYENLEEFKKELPQFKNPLQYSYDSMSRRSKAISGYLDNYYSEEIQKVFGLDIEDYYSFDKKERAITINNLLNNKYEVLNKNELQKIKKAANKFNDKLEKVSQDNWDYNIQETCIVTHIKKTDEAKPVKVTIRGKNLYSTSNDFLETVLRCSELHYCDQIENGIGTDRREGILFDMDFKDIPEEDVKEKSLSLASEQINIVSELLDMNFFPTLSTLRTENGHICLWYLFDTPIYCPNWTRNSKEGISVEEQRRGYILRDTYEFIRKVITLTFKYADAHYTGCMGNNFVNLSHKTNREKGESIAHYDFVTFDSEGNDIDKEEWIEGKIQPSIIRYNFETIARAVMNNLYRIEKYLDIKFDIPLAVYEYLNLPMDKEKVNSIYNKLFNNEKDILEEEKESIVLDFELTNGTPKFIHVSVRPYEGDDITSHKYYSFIEREAEEIRNLLLNRIDKDTLIDRLEFEYRYPLLNEKSIKDNNLNRHQPAFISSSRFTKGLLLDKEITTDKQGIMILFHTLKAYEYYILPYTNKTEIENDNVLLNTSKSMWRGVKSYSQNKSKLLLKKHHFSQSYYSLKNNQEAAEKEVCEYGHNSQIYGGYRRHITAQIRRIDNLILIQEGREVEGSYNYIRNLFDIEINSYFGELEQFIYSEINYKLEHNLSTNRLIETLTPILNIEPKLKKLARVSKNVDYEKLCNLLEALSVARLFINPTDLNDTTKMVEVENFLNRQGIKEEEDIYNFSDYGEFYFRNSLRNNYLVWSDVNKYFDLKKNIRDKYLRLIA